MSKGYERGSIDWHMLGTRIAISMALASIAPIADAQQGWLDWIKRAVLDRVEISGSRTLGFHSYEVEGDREAFRSLNYYGMGDKRWTDVGSLSLQGRKVLGFANFQASVDTNRFRDPNSQHVSLDYDEKPFKVHLGDIQGSMLNTNRFASFSKSLKGVSVEYGVGRWRAKAIVSQAKGAARTISFNGNNSSGPYYLNASQIVPGSESVEVDGQPLKLMDDYTIRYEYGELTFVNRVIPPTSTIVVTFESYGFNSQRGDVQGISTTYNMGRFGRLGLTGMRQVTGGSGALSTRRELFQGAGAPSQPYFLMLEPLRKRPIRVLLNGVEQIENVHYHFDPVNPTIFFFNFFVSPELTIEVIYTPVPTSTASGDREVIGVDYAIPIRTKSGIGELRLYQAEGKLKNELAPRSGIARGIDVRYDFGPYKLRASARNVPETFVGIETRGFNRNEKAYDVGLQFERNGFGADLKGGRSDVRILRTAANGQPVYFSADTRHLSAGFNYNRNVGEPWRLELNSIVSNTQDGRTRLDTAGLSTSRSFGPLNLRMSLENQTGRGPMEDGGKLVEKSIALRTAKLDATYNPSKSWSLVARAGISDIRAGDETGLGKDYSISVNYEAGGGFAIGATHALSDAGQLAILGGFQTGYGLGYNGNGFSNGLGTSFQAGVTNLELTNIRARYELSGRLALNAIAERSKTTGNYSSNSETDRFNVGVDFSFANDGLLTIGVDNANTKFLNSPLRTTATSLMAGLTAKPAKRWLANLGASYLLSGGNSEFEQDSFFVDGSLTYLIDSRQRAAFGFRTGNTSGFLGQIERGWDLSHSYRLWDNLHLVTSYRFREVRNKDGTPSGAYRAKGIDIELRFGF